MLTESIIDRSSSEYLVSTDKESNSISSRAVDEDCPLGEKEIVLSLASRGNY
jgi:hypothetical protein